MRGKVGIVIGLAAGYVLGARAGRERYEQIKTQWLKVWHLDPVQEQVEKVKDFAKSSALAVPGVLWEGAKKVTSAISSKDTPGAKLDAAIDEGEKQSAKVKKAAEKDAREVKKTVQKKVDDLQERQKREAKAAGDASPSGA
jgi:hypothetical protein